MVVPFMINFDWLHDCRLRLLFNIHGQTKSLINIWYNYIMSSPVSSHHRRGPRRPAILSGYNCVMWHIHYGNHICCFCSYHSESWWLQFEPSMKDSCVHFCLLSSLLQQVDVLADLLDSATEDVTLCSLLSPAGTCRGWWWGSAQGWRWPPPRPPSGTSACSWRSRRCTSCSTTSSLQHMLTWDEDMSIALVVQ